MTRTSQETIESVSTRRLTIVDGDGKPRIILSSEVYLEDTDVTKIEFLNRNGEVRLGIELVNESVRIFATPTELVPGIEMRANSAECGFGVGGKCGGTVAFMGQNPNPNLSNSPFKCDEGYLVLRNAESGKQINIPEPTEPNF